MSAYSLTDNRGEYNSFDFSTTRNDVTLTVSYAGCGVNSPVFFEVYDECPVVDDENGYGFTKIDSVKPVFSAYTDENCIYSGLVSLPAYVEKVWVYSPSFFARTLMEARVVGNTISVSDVDAITRSRAITRATDEPGFSYMTRTDAPKEYLAGKRWKVIRWDRSQRALRMPM